MSSCWRPGVFDGFGSVIAETDTIRIEIIPTYGGKTVSLYDKRRNKEWLDVRVGLHPSRPLHTEDDWSQFDCMGWDELFPTVDSCQYPLDPWRGVTLGEHGELWRLDWKADISEDGSSLMLSTEGRKLPYRFEKVVTLVNSTELQLRYSVHNLSESPLFGIWLLHPLLHVTPGSTIEFEPEIHEIEVCSSLHGRLGGRGSICHWPRTTDGVDLRTFGYSTNETADKWFVKSGQSVTSVRVRDAQSGGILSFRLKAQTVPYLGIWSNQAGWHGDSNLAVEPSTGYLDRLDEAIDCNRAMRVPPMESVVWEIELSLH